MATNIMNFNQVATLLNAIQQQATGQTGIVATNTSELLWPVGLPGSLYRLPRSA